MRYTVKAIGRSRTGTASIRSRYGYHYHHNRYWASYPATTSAPSGLRLKPTPKNDLEAGRPCPLTTQLVA